MQFVKSQNTVNTVKI